MTWSLSKYSPVTVDGIVITLWQGTVGSGSDVIYKACASAVTNGSLSYHGFGTSIGEAVVVLMNSLGA